MRTSVLGLFLLMAVSCQEFPIFNLNPVQLSSIFHEDLMSDLTMALSELHPVYLHVSPEEEFFQALHSTSKVPPHPTKPSVQKILHRNPTINVHHDNNYRASNTSPDLKPHSTSMFPIRKNPEIASSNPPLSYGFVPHIPKSKQPSSKLENERLQYSNNGFQNHFFSSELRSPQSHRQQKFEHHNQGLSHVVSQMKEMKSKQVASFKPPLFPFHNGDIRLNSDRQQNPNARAKDTNTYINNQHHNAERGQESIRRPATFVENPHTSLNNDHNVYTRTAKRQSNHEDDHSKISHSGRPQLPMVQIALKVKAPEGSSILNLNDIDESLQDKPIVFLPNPDEDADLEEEEKKTYLLFKAPALITTKRPSSAPFTGTSFFRNIPQSVPRQETSRYPEFSNQIPFAPQNVHSTTNALNPVTVAYDEDDRPLSFRNNSNINIETFHDANLRNEDSFKSHRKYSDQSLHYKDDPYGAVTEVYSQHHFAPTSKVTAQGHRNATFHPISSSSSASYAVQQNNNYKSTPRKVTPKKSKGKKTKYVEESDGHNVPGLAGEDYPIYNEIPLTNFNCKEFKKPGFYADLEAGCQVFHNCDTELQKHSFLCPNGTVFRQELFICDWWYNVKCDDSPEHFPLNGGLYIHP
ncbi:chitin-binding type-2 domain-containing protein [Nephila pilipes]|uniref:Chitin-binding type-2 domain-containing protein n=1 Tax=Nephila pilipes TaxID=299642 RepID=A0A8X6P668_NEPPI|nr:chitin-binding type-2 domain-containing protein [Nephila pilipes]